MKQINEAKFKSFRAIKIGDNVLDGATKTDVAATVLATGKADALTRKYDDSGAAAEAIKNGEMDARADAVAVEFKGGEKAVYAYQDLDVFFYAIECKDNSEEDEDMKENTNTEIAEGKTIRNVDAGSVDAELKNNKVKFDAFDEDDPKKIVYTLKGKKVATYDFTDLMIEANIVEAKKVVKTNEEEDDADDKDKKDVEEETDKDEKDDEDKDEKDMDESEIPSSPEDIVKETKESVDSELDKHTHLECSETLASLVDADETLSEEFKTKASIIFEAAVSEKVSSEIDTIRSECHEIIESRVTASVAAMSEKLDTYLTYSAEAFAEENAETVEAQVRSELAESFMLGLKSLFEEHYIEMPEGKTDIYKDLSEKSDKIEEKLATTESALTEAQTELVALKRTAILDESATGLADTDKIRLSKLTDMLEYTDDESFSEKVLLIKETYFTKHGTSEKEETTPAAPTTVTTRIVEETEESESNSVMDRYVSALGRQMKST